MARRKPISKKKRFEVFKRDGFRCQYCGATPPSVLLHVDHIHPVAEGGTNDDDNLITACEPCNIGKGAGLLSEAPQSLADKATETAEREEQLQGYQAVLRDRRERLDAESWEVADIYMKAFGRDYIEKADRQSIKRFVEQICVVDVLDSMEQAVATKSWSAFQCFKYFCGICWNKVRAQKAGGG